MGSSNSSFVTRWKLGEEEVGDSLDQPLPVHDLGVVGQGTTPGVLDTPQRHQELVTSSLGQLLLENWHGRGLGEMQTTQLVSGPPRPWKWGAGELSGILETGQPNRMSILHGGGGIG